MKINGFFLFTSVFLFVIVLSNIYYPLRYLKYALPLVPMLLYLTKEDLAIHKKIASYYLFFLGFYTVVIVYLLLQNIIFSEVSSRFLPNTVFILSPLLFVFLIQPFFKVKKVKQYVVTILIINILLFCYEQGSNLSQVITSLSVFRNALLSSQITTESNLAYVFGFLVLFLILEKYPKIFLIVTFIFLILCFKRIVIVAVAVSLFIYFFISFFRVSIPRHRITWTFLGVTANLLYIKVTQLIVDGSFDMLVYENTGVSTDAFLMGRKTFYNEAFEEAGAMNWFGIGLGKIDDIMFNFFGIPVNLHSEILKNYFEFGVLIFIMWLWLLFYKTLFSNKSAILLIYFNILILTDNVFIYFDIMFYFYFFILIFLYQKYAEPKLSKDELQLRY